MPVKIDITCGIPLLWNECDKLYIQNNCRILGKSIGPLPKSSNSHDLGMPLTLTNEEVKLLIEKEYAELVKYPHLQSDSPTEVNEKCRALQEVLSQQNIHERKKSRLTEIEQLSCKIWHGKQSKQRKLFSMGKSDIRPEKLTFEGVKEELLQTVVSREERKIVQIYMEHPFLKDLPLIKGDWLYPHTKRERLKYRVFQDLWGKGYYLSCGIKFGGDYIAYGGDPQIYHASFIIKCIEDDEKINPKDIILWCRLGTVTQKTLILCSLDESEVVRYLSIQWPGNYLDTL